MRFETWLSPEGEQGEAMTSVKKCLRLTSKASFSASFSPKSKWGRLLVEIKHYVDMRSHPEQYLAHGRRSVFVLCFSFLTLPEKKKGRKKKSSQI